eukprot:3936428-Rhodomonas_salina.2
MSGTERGYGTIEGPTEHSAVQRVAIPYRPTRSLCDVRYLPGLGDVRYWGGACKGVSGLVNCVGECITPLPGQYNSTLFPY